jgi:hypothetical protein
VFGVRTTYDGSERRVRKMRLVRIDKRLFVNTSLQSRH